MNKYNLLALTFVALSGSIAHAVFDMTAKFSVGVQTCVGGGSVDCKQVINAVDVGKLTIPLKTLKIEPIDLSTGIVNVELPVGPGGRTAYSLVPSTGDSAGKTVHLVFENVPQRAGTKDYGKLMIKVYRHIQGIDIADQFSNIGSITIEKLSFPFNAKPDGTLSTQDQNFFLGKKNEAAAAA